MWTGDGLIEKQVARADYHFACNGKPTFPITRNATCRFLGEYDPIFDIVDTELPLNIVDLLGPRSLIHLFRRT